MKKPWQSRYFEISAFTALLAVFVSGTILVMNNIGSIFSMLCHGIFWILSLFKPLYIALIVAFILNPVVDFFQNETSLIFKAKTDEIFKKRTRGTACAYVFIFVVIFSGIKLTIKNFGTEEVLSISQVIENFIWDTQNMLYKIKSILDKTGLFYNTDYAFEGLINKFFILSQNFVFSVASSAGNAGKTVLNIVVGLTAAFYFLSEKDRLIYRLKDMAKVFFPEKFYKFVKNNLYDINDIFYGYVTGQIIDAVIMAFLVSIAMWFLGIKYFFIIGIISGIANLIPYAGAFAAFILSVACAAAEGGTLRAVYSAIAVIFIQQIDSMILVPKIIGSKVKLHPVLVIISLSVFGSVWGIGGMIIAVPVTAFIKKKFDRIYMKRRFSP